MNFASIAATTVGGLGLFLLGMSMMTDGLKLAAGPALTHILAAATRTRWHALGAGMLVTALVQASGAVTVATIGFVNAGLLGLAPALWVLFGANVGTTMTGWIVALVGLKFDIQMLALPLIGVGVVLKLTGERSRRGALGGALAGLGLLFLGIAMLQSAFGGLAGQVTLPQGEGALAVLAQVGVGLAMTVLMQSSSAAIAIALTAAQGGLIPLHGAAAVVIGANIGTTVTAVLATLGATPNARRAAAAHVLFNALTGLVALALLPWLVAELARGAERLGMGGDVAAVLALFHTCFNLLGVVLMWPLADRLARWLGQRFRAREEVQGQPRYLDDNVLAVPELAVQALESEVARAGALAAGMVRRALEGAPRDALDGDGAVFASLDQAIIDFAARLGRSPMMQASSERVAQVLRLHRYHETAAEQAQIGAGLRAVEAGTGPRAALAPAPEADAAARGGPALPQQGTVLGRVQAGWCRLAQNLLTARGAAATPARGAMETGYQDMKAALLRAGAAGAIGLDPMEEALRRWSALRRAVQQLDKAARLAEALGGAHDQLASEGESA